MLELEKWGRGREPLMSMFSHTVALGAEAACELCEVGRDGEFRAQLGRIEDKRAWLGNYRKQGFFAPDPDFARNFFTASVGKKAGKRIGEDIELAREYQAATTAQKSAFTPQ